jgi:hypothetical protein
MFTASMGMLAGSLLREPKTPTVEEVAARIIEKVGPRLEAEANALVEPVAECVTHRIALSLDDQIELGVFRALASRDAVAKRDQRRAKAQLDILTVKACETLLDAAPQLVEFLFRKPGY